MPHVGQKSSRHNEKNYHTFLCLTTRALFISWEILFRGDLEKLVLTSSAFAWVDMYDKGAKNSSYRSYLRF